MCRWVFAWMPFFLSASVLDGCVSDIVPDEECRGADRAYVEVIPPARRTATAGSEVSIEAILVRACRGTVAGAPVRFGIVGPGDHAVQPSEAVTSREGLAVAVVRVGRAGHFQVEASAEDAEPAYFTLDVVEPRLTLRAVVAGPLPASTSSRLPVSFVLTATDERGPGPLAGALVAFALDRDDGADLERALRTSPHGIVTPMLRTGPLAKTLELSATIDGTAPARIAIDVADAEASGCARTADCTAGRVCHPDGRCVRPHGADNPDGCLADPDCDAGFVCRSRRCLEPTFSGKVCALDDECGAGVLCISGLCTPDPREKLACRSDRECGPRACVDGECSCSGARECPVGWACGQDGACRSPAPGLEQDGCVADADCHAAELCERAICHVTAECGEVDLSGSWVLRSRLDAGRLLPGTLTELLARVDELLGFLGDPLVAFDLDVPVVGGEIRRAARSAVRRVSPEWSGRLREALRELDGRLPPLRVIEELDLHSVGSGELRGETEWSRVTAQLRGQVQSATSADVEHWERVSDEITARASCGTVSIDPHDVRVPAGALAVWLMDGVVGQVTRGAHRTIEELLVDTTDEVCTGAAAIVQELVIAIGDGVDLELSDVAAGLEDACFLSAEPLLNEALDGLAGLGAEVEVARLAGRATVGARGVLEDGQWQGELYGQDVTGEFTATR